MVPEGWYISVVQPSPPHEPTDVLLHSILTCWEKSCVLQVMLQDFPLTAGKHGEKSSPNPSEKQKAQIWNVQYFCSYIYMAEIFADTINHTFVCIKKLQQEAKTSNC